jgi:hypothetical protein
VNFVRKAFEALARRRLALPAFYAASVSVAIFAADWFVH